MKEPNDGRITKMSTLSRPLLRVTGDLVWFDLSEEPEATQNPDVLILIMAPLSAAAERKSRPLRRTSVKEADSRSAICYALMTWEAALRSTSTDMGITMKMKYPGVSTHFQRQMPDVPAGPLVGLMTTVTLQVQPDGLHL